MAAGEAPAVADTLRETGYRALFSAGSRDADATVWAGGEGREPLEAIVRGDEFGDVERLLASEVLFRHAPGYPPDGWGDTLGRVYAAALARTSAGDGPVLWTANDWGFLSYGEANGMPDGPLGEHLMAAGPAAVPHLVTLLDDAGPIRYEGSKEAMVGNGLRFRVKDAAAYFIGRLRGIEGALPVEPERRDAEIERLREQVGPA